MTKCICGFDDETTKEKTWDEKPLGFIRIYTVHGMETEHEDCIRLMACPKCNTVRLR